MDELLKLELRILLLRYGRGRILQALGALTEHTAEQVEEEIAALEARKTKRIRKSPPSALELITDIANRRPEAAQTLRVLATRYENRTFLPRIKDIQRFLDRFGVPHRTLKSRRLAARHVLNALSHISTEELDRLARLSPEGENASDYADLAREIMGRRP